MAYGFGEGFGEEYISPGKRQGGGLSGPPAGTRFGPAPNMRNEGQENAMTLANMVGPEVGTTLMEGAGKALSSTVAPTVGAGVTSGTTAIMGMPGAAAAGGGLASAIGSGLTAAAPVLGPLALPALAMALFNKGTPNVTEGATEAVQSTMPLPQTELPSWFDPNMSMEDIMKNVRARAKQKMMERQMQVPPQGMENPTAPATPRSPRAMEPSGDYLQRRNYNPSMSADPTPAGMVPTFNYPLPAMVDAMGGARSTPMVDKTTPALPAPTIWDKIKDVSVMRGVNNYMQGMQGIQGPSFNKGTYEVAEIEPQKYNSGSANVDSIPTNMPSNINSAPVIPIAPSNPGFLQRFFDKFFPAETKSNHIGGGGFASYQGGPLNIQGVPMSDREMKMDLHQQKLRHNEDKHQKTMYA